MKMPEKSIASGQDIHAVRDIAVNGNRLAILVSDPVHDTVGAFLAGGL
jgi:hypothetical protein